MDNLQFGIKYRFMFEIKNQLMQFSVMQNMGIVHEHIKTDWLSMHQKHGDLPFPLSHWVILKTFANVKTIKKIKQTNKYIPPVRSILEGARDRLSCNNFLQYKIQELESEVENFICNCNQTTYSKWAQC